jgi:hypothetical protein
VGGFVIDRAVHLWQLYKCRKSFYTLKRAEARAPERGFYAASSSWAFHGLELSGHLFWQ